MSFKSEYQKDFDKINAEESFKSELKDILRAESGKKKKNNIYIYGSVLAAVAVLAIVMGVVLKNGKANVNNNHKEDNTQVTVQVQENSTADSLQGSISNDKWYKTATTDEEKFKVLVQLIRSNALETLYCSEETTFDNDDALGKADAEYVMNRIVSAKKNGEDMTGKVKNYMAVFAQGEIVKFTISENGYIRFNDLDATYKY